MEQIHYGTFTGTSCGLYGEAVVKTDNWDRVTCRKCLSECDGGLGCGVWLFFAVVVVVVLVVLGLLITLCNYLVG